MKIENMTLLELLKLERDDNIKHVITNANLKNFVIYRSSLKNHIPDTIDENEIIYITTKQHRVVITDLIKFLETGETVHGEIKPTAECDFLLVYTIEKCTDDDTDKTYIRFTFYRYILGSEGEIDMVYFIVHGIEPFESNDWCLSTMNLEV